MDKQKIIYSADVIARLGGPSGPFVIVERLGSMKGFALPGGKQDPGEALSATAVREFYEETGLSLEVFGVLGTFAETGRDPRGHYISTVFLGIAYGQPQGEEGKTRVLLMTEDDIRTHKNTFVFDHFSIFDKHSSLPKETQMQVLKKGREQRGWSKEYTCTGKGNGGGGCGALLLVSEYDIYQTSSSDYGGGTDYYKTFSCSECGVETDIVDSSAPVKGSRPQKK